MNTHLLKYCQNATEREDFVGICFDFDKELNAYRPYITFPYGYDIACNDDVICLIQVLSDYHREYQGFGVSELSEDSKNGFPIQSYLFVIQYYLNNGYYIEKDNIYQKQTHGKVNWGRTVKQEKPIIQSSGAIYLTLQAKNHQYNDTYLITEINKYCVYESFLKMGWFYGLSLPTKPNSKFNKTLFIATLQDKLSKTNKDFDKQLFQSMLNVLNVIDEYQNNTHYFTFGTRRFEKVWEFLVDKAFGTEFGEQKAKYFPKASWQLNNQVNKTTNSLFPDTIRIEHKDIYVIDAKYYRYGVTNNIKHLPEISSIAKQITYAQYIENQFDFKNIYNIFVLPFNAKKSQSSIYFHIGCAVADWVNDKNDYKYIDTILVDCQYLMKNYHSKQLYHLDCCLNNNPHNQ